jgi:peptide/nickel transport system ATP-binding protein
MSDLQKEKGMAIIFITHDLGVIAQLCDDVAVMYAGRVVERATVFDIFKFPSHPYTKGLLASIPRLDGVPKTMLSTIEGQVPSLHNMPSGCRFNNRCPHSNEQCLQIIPELVNCGDRHEVSCFHWQRLAK